MLDFSHFRPRVYAEVCKEGGIAKIPHEKIFWEIPAKRTPSIHRAKLGGKFLGFFRDFSALIMINN